MNEAQKKGVLAATCKVKKRRKLFFASVREPSLGRRILKMFRVRRRIHFSSTGEPASPTGVS